MPRVRPLSRPEETQPPVIPMTDTYTVTFVETGLTFPCRFDTNVLEGMAKLGLRGIPVGCKGGGCGVCKIHVVEGLYDKGIMSRNHITKEDEANNDVLACRIYPRSDLLIRVSGKLKKAFGLN